MQIFDLIFVHFMQFPVLNFGLDHFTRKPYKLIHFQYTQFDLLNE